MSHDRHSTFNKLNKFLEAAPTQVPRLPIGEKYVVFSDLHLGDGNSADDFCRNEAVLLSALDFYCGAGYTLVLLGDIEELWQFDIDQIADRYQSTVYRAMRKFGSNIVRVWGNHDSEWGCPQDPVLIRRRKGEPEALMLVDADENPRILLLHGHQGSDTSDKNCWISRFVVRGLYKPIEGIARWLDFDVHPSATKSQVTKKYEEIYYSWAKLHSMAVICGHSHRAIFASRSYSQRLEEEIGRLRELLNDEGSLRDREQIRREIRALERELDDEREKGRSVFLANSDGKQVPCYFNTGCGLYADGVTAIEIAQGNISLVKWDRDTCKKDPGFSSCQDSLNSVLRAIEHG